jgi:hypothetical protein
MKWHISFSNIAGAFTAFKYSLGDDQENFGNSISGANNDQWGKGRRVRL